MKTFLPTLLAAATLVLSARSATTINSANGANIGWMDWCGNTSNGAGIDNAPIRGGALPVTLSYQRL